MARPACVIKSEKVGHYCWVYFLIYIIEFLSSFDINNMSFQIRLLNLPWTYTRQELSKYLSRTFNTRVKYSKILYDKQTGLSRGIGIVNLESDKLTRDVVRRGSLVVEGRNVIVMKGRTREQE